MGAGAWLRPVGQPLIVAGCTGGKDDTLVSQNPCIRPRGGLHSAVRVFVGTSQLEIKH